MGLFGLGRHTPASSSANRTVAKSVPLVKDATGATAVDLVKVESTGGISLRKKTEAVHASLDNSGLAGMRAQVMVVLDHSGSMHSDYANNKVQDIVERFLGFGLAVDVDGEIPVIAFDHKVHGAVNVNMTNYKDVVSREIWKPNAMGSTDLTGALEEVRKQAMKTDAPLFVAIVTDGEPDDRQSAKELIIDLARYPVFIKFLAVQPVAFLSQLDDLSDNERLLDNVDTKSYRDLRAVEDKDFADDMTDEWDSWVEAALSAGVLTNG